MFNVSANCKIIRELQDDKRTTAGTDGGHLIQAGELAELPFQRCGDGGRSHVRARAGVERDNLYGGIIDLRQRRNGQLAVRHNARQQNRDHQQRSRHWPQNELT